MSREPNTFMSVDIGYMGNDPLGVWTAGVPETDNNVIWALPAGSRRREVFLHIAGAQLDSNAPSLFIRGSVDGSKFTFMDTFDLDSPGFGVSQGKVIRVPPMPYYQFQMQDHATELAIFRIQAVC